MDRTAHRVRARRRPSRVVALLLAFSIAGCYTLKPVDQRVYDAYLRDPNPPHITLPHSAAAAAWLSVAWPGAGFFYLGDTVAGAFWSTLGLPLWPLLVPCFQAKKLARYLNSKHIVAEYRRLRPNWGQQQQQQQQQQQTTVIQLGAGGGGGVVQPVQPARQSAATHCAKCGAGNPASSRFCNSCGENTTPLPGAQAFCPGCGVKNQPGATYCTSCGVAIRR
jgi:hypothetical protein